MNFFGDFELRSRQERIARKSIEIDMEIGKAAYEISSIERRFRRSKSRFF